MASLPTLATIRQLGQLDGSQIFEKSGVGLASNPGPPDHRAGNYTTARLDAKGVL